MATFSFDIVSEYDKAEMNNVFAAVERDIMNRYDFKGTPAAIEWLDNKQGFKVTGANEWQLESITDLIRKHMANRGQSTKSLDLSQASVESNLKITHSIPFIEGLDQEKAKRLTKLLRDQLPKLKTSIHGEAVRVQSSSKDELQKAMQLLRAEELNFALSFTNFR